MYTKCSVVATKISEIIDHKASFLTRLRFYTHLIVCSKCRQYFNQFKPLKEASEQLDPDELSNDFDNVTSFTLNEIEIELKESSSQEKNAVRMKRVLVLCTGNSCRSILAETIINQLGVGCFEAVSAGSCPAGYIHPKSLETLKRHGFEPVRPRSKSWDEYEGEHFDLVITVCDAAANESCPAFLGRSKRLHWSTPDPAKASGSEQEVNDAFDEVFIKLRDRIKTELL